MHRRTLLLTAILLTLPTVAAADVTVAILEGMPDQRAWNLEPARVADQYGEPGFGLVALPVRFSDKGQTLDRSSPFVVQAEGKIQLAAGEYRLLLRSLNASRLYVDGKLAASLDFIKAGGSHEAVPNLPTAKEKDLYPLPLGHREQLVTLKLAAGLHEFKLEGVVGGQKLRPELGQLCVGIAKGAGPFHILGTTVPLSDERWDGYCTERRHHHAERNNVARLAAQAGEQKFWVERHEIARREWAGKPAIVVPETKSPIHNAVDHFIGQRLDAKNETAAPLTDDLTFLRRVTLDVLGLPPTPEQIAAFAADRSPERRANVVQRLLADPSWADHWVGYWQDVLAENPGILKPTLNNTGPFRWFLHQAFRDNMPMDRLATELILMEGSKLGGAPAGFGMATENDAPLAAKAHVLGKAFLGIDLQCARCHDAPTQPYKQKDTFSLAALLARTPQSVPPTSTVKVLDPARPPRVTVTLKPGVKVAPVWPFPQYAPAELPEGVLRNSDDPRERFAAILTSPRNERFAQVLVNRVWKRYLGQGLVESVDDWQDPQPSHPELLRYLARELITHDYDLKHVSRLILNSHAYQRVVQPGSSAMVGPDNRLFAAPMRRRLAAEQIVDSLFAVAGKEFHSEELTLDPEGRQKMADMLHLGRPTRSWQFTSLSNDRDRPALSLPVAQSIIDLLITFGWRDSRQNPLTIRDETPTPLQPLLLANGVVGTRITRVSDDSAFATLALKDQTPAQLVEALFERVLTRQPTAAERDALAAVLADGYAERRVAAPATAAKPAVRQTAVSWANHLNPEATRIKLELEKAARAGDPPTQRLKPEWRERLEDVLWALVNTPEFMFVP